MTRRRLGPDESALWRRVTATIAPLSPQPLASASPPLPPALPALIAAKPIARVPIARVKGRVPPPPAGDPAPLRRASLARATLDSHWDRRLRKGLVQPDLSIDLHGHGLASAHALLDVALGRALHRGARVVLVIAGRVRPGPHHAPAQGEARPRGAIRAALPDWLAASVHSASILATRPAHISHGGGGAVYVVLRRGGEG